MAAADLVTRLINGYQRDFPLTPRPFRDIGESLGLRENEVLSLVQDLRDQGALARVGAVVAPNTIGASTLAAMAVPAQRLDAVAAIVSGYGEVNHNYEREHDLNLWFVVAAASAEAVAAVLRDIEARTGLAVIDLPLIEAFHIDLGFPLPCP
ncbi:MAG: Lrp/AsnC family transcriptional regulator [Rhodospirillales bacterium]|nr:Lrp/AsnC family transcriptional regulator [Rhodospirillales bacterium]